MTAGRLCDDLEMYVLGGLNPEERKQFEEHLKHDPACQKEVAAMKAVIRYLPLAAQEVEPPMAMKFRILSQVLQSPHDADLDARAPRGVDLPAAQRYGNRKPARRRRLYLHRGRSVDLLGISSMLLLLATSILFVSLSGMSEEKSLLQSQVSKLQSELAASYPSPSGLEVREVAVLKPPLEESAAHGTVMTVGDSTGTHLILQAEQLPELQGGEAFQVWLLKQGKPLSAGTFITQDGTGALYFSLPDDEYDGIAVTQEPDATGLEPRGKSVLAANVAVSGRNGGA